MYRPVWCLVFLVVVAGPAIVDVCSAEYSPDQCDQLNGDNNGGPAPGGTCPFYMCGNATTAHQSSEDWCEATQSYQNCPIYYCRYSPCIGTNCYPTSMTCSTCSSRQGNNVHLSDCPRI